MPLWRWADLQVQIGPVSHESWWSQNSGSIAVAVAAIVAASLAAYVAIKNRREELAQSRELNERNHIRNTLDSVFEQIDRTMAVQTDVVSSLAVRDMADDETERSIWLPEIQEMVSKANNELLVMRGRQVRLELRLGKDHPIPNSHRELLEELSEWLSSMVKRSVSPDPIDTKKDMDSADTVAEKFSYFRADCGNWFYATPCQPQEMAS
jgi:hypothetical protein